MQKNVKWQLFATSLLLLNSCAPKPPNVPACEHLGQHLSSDPISGHLLLTPSPTCLHSVGEPECGHCVLIVTGEEFFIGENSPYLLNGKPWSKIRGEAVYLPAVESYAPLSAYIIDACKKMKCSDDVTRFKVKLDFLKGLPAQIP